MQDSERGNILFLILLAVVLFAALSYAVTSSMRGEGKSAANENAQILASQIVENSALIEQTITRAKLMDNIQDWGFDFYRGQSPSASSTNATCTQSACKIFVDNGGKVPFIVIPDWASVSSNANEKTPSFYAAEIINVGTNAPELVVVYNYLTRDLCLELNKVLKNSDVTLTPGDGFGGSNMIYTGTLTAMPNGPGTVGDANTTLKGKKAACYDPGGTGTNYRYFYAIMER